jgi:anaerobic selenocysteine-containing dehydrogenase
MSAENPMRHDTVKVRTYCAQCYNNCPVIAYVERGRFVRVTADTDHPYHRPLCPKGLAGPELVYSSSRLTTPLKRTNPKTSHDPGWARISWEEALQHTTSELLRIREERGPEAVAFTQSFVSTPLWEIQPYLRRLSNVYGSPNTVATSHICNWHRDFASAFTFAQPRTEFAAGWPEFEKSSSILIWGCNTQATMPSLHVRIENALAKGVRLVVVDPRRTELARRGDVWLQIQPGTDGALALAMLNCLLSEKRHDSDFLCDWTNAPFLLRTDSGLLLSPADVPELGEEGYVAIGPQGGGLVRVHSQEACMNGLEPFARRRVDLKDGTRVDCVTVGDAFVESLASYTPEAVESITRVPAARVREAVEVLAENRPTSWYSYNGIEQSANATQTNRALCVFHALLGDHDAPGGNIVWRRPPLTYPMGLEFVTPEMIAKTVGRRANPLGPSGTLMSVPAHALYRSVLHEDPYAIVGLVGFGGNLLMSNPDTLSGVAALRRLEFQVHSDLFMTPTAELADIVLPATSFWEASRLGFLTDYLGREYYLHWRPAVIAPRDQGRDDLAVILDLGQRISPGENLFWGGDPRAAQEVRLSRLDLTLEDIEASPGGLRMPMQMSYKKYVETGFRTPSGRVEVFSQTLRQIGRPPLPTWSDPFGERSSHAGYPLTLTNAKLKHFCQTQHRALPSLRRVTPHPFAEIHPDTAAEYGLNDGDWTIVETVSGRIRVAARLTDALLRDVVCVQHGWWQRCGELELAGYDPESPSGANANLLYDSTILDPVSGSVQLKGVPCRIRKA